MARDTPGRDAWAAKNKGKPSKKPPKKPPKKPTSISSLLDSPLPGTTFAPPPPKRPTGKKPSKRPPERARDTPGRDAHNVPKFDFLRESTSLRSYQDLVKEGRKSFFARVPPNRRIARDPGTFEQWLATRSGTSGFSAHSPREIYDVTKRNFEESKKKHAAWRAEREKEWQDVLSGKAEAEARAEFFKDESDVSVMPKALWKRQNPKGTNAEYDAYVEAKREQKRAFTRSEWDRMNADPEAYAEEQSRKARDPFAKVFQAGVGGAEMLGLPKSVANDLRLISAGLLPGVWETAKLTYQMATGNPDAMGAMIDETIEAYKRNYADPGSYVAKHPVLFGLDAAILLGPATKLASVVALSRSIRLSNPGMGMFEANRLASAESRNPGYLATRGTEGGLKPRVLEGKTSQAARPQSRSPLGRSLQRGYDAFSRGLEKGPILGEAPVLKKFTTSNRAEVAQAKIDRRGRQRTEALLAAIQDPVTSYTSKGGKARLKRLIGQVVPERGRAEGIVAALEAGTDVTQALTERIATLQNVLDEGIKWDSSINPEVLAPYVQMLTEKFPDVQVGALTQLAETMARALRPNDPDGWVRDRLSDVKNMDAEDFLSEAGAAAAQFQLTHGERRHLTEDDRSLDTYRIDVSDIEATLRHNQDALAQGWGGDQRVIYFTNPEGVEMAMIPRPTGFEKITYDPRTGDSRGSAVQMTFEEAADYLLKYGNEMWQSSEGKRAADWARETPVFYSPLQRAIAALPGHEMKAGKLQNTLRDMGIGKIEWEMMGLDAFFFRETRVLNKKSGKWRNDPDVVIPYSKLQAHLHDPLNAYNLDEIVRVSTVERDRMGGTIWNDEPYYGDQLVARHPTPQEPYYEITMTLGSLHPRQLSSGQPYRGKAYSHWEDDNILVHIRFHIITDLDGKKAMLIDEIQSDWYSDWRRSGSWEYGDPELDVEMQRQRDALFATNNRISNLIDEPRERLRNARNEYDNLRYTLEQARDVDPEGGTIAIRHLEDQVETARKELDEAHLVHQENLEATREEVQRLTDEARDIQFEINKLRDAKMMEPPPMKGKELQVAVRRASRWAAEANVDRIIVVPGEVQAFRNNAYGVTPKGRKIDLMSLHNTQLHEHRNHWVEDVGDMDPDELHEFGRNVGAVASGKAKSYFTLYEKDIPSMFAKTLRSKAEFRDQIYLGHYGDQAGGLGRQYSGLPNSSIGGTVIEMTPEAREIALLPMSLFQRQPNWDGLPRGASGLLEDGRSTYIRLFEGADVDTVIHELAHVAFHDLPPEIKKILEDYYGSVFTEWTEQQHEAFARGFENFLASGKAPTLELQSAFRKIREWMVAIWQRLKQDPDAMALPPEIDRVFEYMVTPRDRSPLSEDQRNWVKSQIKDLEYALKNQGDPDEQARALDALQEMSGLVEDYGRQIMLFGLDDTPDPDTGESELQVAEAETDAMLERRRNAYTELLRSMGIIDPDDTQTRAGGYFPNLHIARAGGDVPIDPTKIPATSNTLGAPRARPDAVNLKRNQFVRLQTGKLNMNPATLFDVLRMRIKHLATLQIRQQLYDLGDPIEKDMDLNEAPADLMFIRNPTVDARRISEMTRAGLGMDEQSFMSLVERGEDPVGEMDMKDPEATGSKSWLENVWWNGKTDANGKRVSAPHWAESQSDVRTIKRSTAENLIGDVFPHAPRGGSMAAVANALARMSMLYAPGPIPGSRYTVRNFLQNAVLMGMTHPGSLRYAVDAVKTLERDENRALRNKIDAEAGSTRAEAGMPEYYLRAQNRRQRLERTLTETQKTVGGGLSRVADEVFRRSAWIGYAERYGFHGPEGWARLLDSDDPNVARARDLISQAVRDDLIDFDAMSSKERAIASRYFFLYPFIRGSLKWPFMFAREYPFRAGVIGALAAQEGQRREEGQLAKTTSEGGRTRLQPGKRQYEIGWLDPFSPAAQTLETLTSLSKGMSVRDFTALAQMLSPELRVLAESLAGNASKSRPWGSVLSSFLPGYSSAEKYAKGGSLADQLLRHMGLSVEVSPSRYIQRQQANAELLAAWSWAQANGVPVDVTKVRQSAIAYERYKDLDQRIDFSQKDRGEGSLRAADLSEAQRLEREQQEAVALTVAVAEGYPETRSHLTGMIKQIRTATLEDLEAYNEAMRRRFRYRNALINAYKRSQG